VPILPEDASLPRRTTDQDEAKESHQAGNQAETTKSSTNQEEPAEPDHEAEQKPNQHQNNPLEPSRGSPSYPSQPRLASGVTHSPSCAAPRNRGWGLFTLLSAGPTPTVIPVYAVESRDGRVLLLLLCGGGSFFFVVVLIEP